MPKSAALRLRMRELRSRVETRARFRHGRGMPSTLSDDAFNGVAFADLDTLTDRELYDLNAELVGLADVGRAEEWRSRISDILVTRI